MGRIRGATSSRNSSRAEEAVAARLEPPFLPLPLCFREIAEHDVVRLAVELLDGHPVPARRLVQGVEQCPPVARAHRLGEAPVRLIRCFRLVTTARGRDQHREPQPHGDLGAAHVPHIAESPLWASRSPWPCARPWREVPPARRSSLQSVLHSARSADMTDPAHPNRAVGDDSAAGADEFAHIPRRRARPPVVAAGGRVAGVRLGVSPSPRPALRPVEQHARRDGDGPRHLRGRQGGPRVHQPLRARQRHARPGERARDRHQRLLGVLAAVPGARDRRPPVLHRSESPLPAALAAGGHVRRAAGAGRRSVVRGRHPRPTSRAT